MGFPLQSQRQTAGLSPYKFLDRPGLAVLSRSKLLDRPGPAGLSRSKVLDRPGLAGHVPLDLPTSVNRMDSLTLVFSSKCERVSCSEVSSNEADSKRVHRVNRIENLIRFTLLGPGGHPPHSIYPSLSIYLGAQAPPPKL